jgi:hypothetical protein
MKSMATFTIRGVSNPEKMTLTVSGKGRGSGKIKGKMVFNRKNYGMNKGILFVKIGDHVEVDLHLKGKRVGGPPDELRVKVRPQEILARSPIPALGKQAPRDGHHKQRCLPVGISPEPYR